MSKVEKGFTLIELLVVIAIIAVLAASVFVSLDPITRFAEARNARRWEDVNSISTAIRQYVVDNDGALPTGLDINEKQLGTCSSGGGTYCGSAVDACLNIASLLAPYLKVLPEDPSAADAERTAYSVSADANNIVTVRACSAELSVIIQIPLPATED